MRQRMHTHTCVRGGGIADVIGIFGAARDRPLLCSLRVRGGGGGGGRSEWSLFFEKLKKGEEEFALESSSRFIGDFLAVR